MPRGGTGPEYEVIGATLPGMKAFTNRYSTRSDLRDLRGIAKDSQSLASTNPLYVAPHRETPGFSRLGFHSALYSHAATRPFRPLVVRGRLSDARQGGRALAQALLMTAVSAAAAAGWRAVPEDLLRRMPAAGDVPFAVTPRTALEWLAVAAEPRSAAGAAAGLFAFPHAESVFAPIGASSVVATLLVPPEAAAYTAGLNRRLGLVQPSMERCLGTLAHAARGIHNVRLHAGDALFVPRGWRLRFEACADEGATVPGLAPRGTSEAARRPRADWEQPTDFELVVAAREEQRRAANKAALDEAVVLRHCYRPFPEVSESEARLMTAKNLTEVETFYQPGPPLPSAVAVTGRVK